MARSSCAQRYRATASRVGLTRFLCRNVMNTGAGRVKGHSRRRYIYDNRSMPLSFCLYRSRAIRACSTRVISALLASARWRASVVMIGASGPICSASRTSSGE